MDNGFGRYIKCAMMMISMGCFIVVTNSSGFVKPNEYEFNGNFDFSINNWKIPLEFSKCLKRCNFTRCRLYIAKRKFMDFGVCVAECVEENCLQYVDSQASFLYECTLGCTKFRVIDFGYGK